LSNRQFVEPTVCRTDSLSNRQFVEPTVCRTDSLGVIDIVSWLSQSTDIFTNFSEVNLQLQRNGVNLIKAK